MDFQVKRNTQDINWAEVNQLLKGFGLTNHTVLETKFAFEHSQEVVFILLDNRLIGCGRALTDYIAQAAIYNIAVDKDYQGLGIGKVIIKTFVDYLSKCNITLYTHPDTVSWYKQLGFESMKTGMAIYHESHIEELRKMNFV